MRFILLLVEVLCQRTARKTTKHLLSHVTTRFPRGSNHLKITKILGECSPKYNWLPQGYFIMGMLGKCYPNRSLSQQQHVEKVCKFKSLPILPNQHRYYRHTETQTACMSALSVATQLTNIPLLSSPLLNAQTQSTKTQN